MVSGIIVGYYMLSSDEIDTDDWANFLPFFFFFTFLSFF